MNKALIAALCSTTIMLAACGDNEDTDEQNDQTNGEESTEANTEEQAEDMTAEEILTEAIAFYDDLDSLHVEREGSLNQEIDTPEQDEDMNDANVDMMTSDKQWQFQQEDGFYQRTEIGMNMVVDEEGEEEVEDEMPTSYSFTDSEDPAYMITYEEGDNEALRYENPTSDESLSFDMHGQEYEAILEDAELSLVGEETINGYDTYHIEADQDGEITEYWFDKDTFFEIKRTLDSSSESPDGEFSNEGGGIDTVVDYEVNPDFDASLFQAPDDIEVVDGEIDDTIG